MPNEYFDFGDDNKTQKKSPCPSPTPVFQQLYLAIANYERLLSESPDSMKDNRGKNADDSENIERRSRCNSLGSTNDISTLKVDGLRRGSSPGHISSDKIGMLVEPIVKIRINSS